MARAASQPHGVKWGIRLLVLAIVTWAGSPAWAADEPDLIFRRSTVFKLLTPNDLSVPEYDAVYLYKAAAEKAKTTAAEPVIAALAEVSFDGPRGKVQMNAQRHAPLTMYLGQVQADGSVKIVKSFPNVSPGEQCPKL